jgi:hypothetical protein
MKRLVFILILITIVIACQKQSMRGKYDYLVGTWTASSSQWCSADSANSRHFELEFTNNANVIFRKNGEEKKFDIISKRYETYSDYKIWYRFVLDNDETLAAETEAVAGFGFNTILITSHRDFFECANDSAIYRPLGRAM